MNPDTLNTLLCRALLAMVHEDVRRAFPRVHVIAAASVTSTLRGQYHVEIQVPRRPRFHADVHAWNATEARYMAWVAFLRKSGAAGYAREECA